MSTETAAAGLPRAPAQKDEGPQRHPPHGEYTECMFPVAAAALPADYGTIRAPSSALRIFKPLGHYAMQIVASASAPPRADILAIIHGDPAAQ